MNSVVSLVLREISKQNKSSVIIAVDGRCAAGKTYLASRIKEAINCNVIHMDHFFCVPSSVPVRGLENRVAMWIMSDLLRKC